MKGFNGKLIVIMLMIAFLSGCMKTEKTIIPDALPKPPAPMSGTGLFLGLVAFNATVSSLPMTEDTVKVNATIRKMDNAGQTSTGLCYAIEKGVKILKELNNKQNLDQGYIIAFTDGGDNYSSYLFGQDHIDVPQPEVVNRTKNILENTYVKGEFVSNKIKCFTIGYKSSDLRPGDLKQLAVNGQYYPANQSDFNTVFQQVANSLVQTSKNVAFSTNITKWTQSAPKNYSITLTGYDSTLQKVTGTIRGKFWLENIQSPVPTFSVTYKSNNLSFFTNNNIIIGHKEKIGINDKAVIPFDNLTFTGPTGQAIISTSASVLWSETEQGPFIADTEDAQDERPIAKYIGVVLVLDCSSSLGPQLLAELKVNSTNFINTVLKSKK